MFSIKEEYIELKYWEKKVKYEPFSKRMKVYQLPHKINTSSFVKEIIDLGVKNDCNKVMFYIKEHEIDLLSKSICSDEGASPSLNDRILHTKQKTKLLSKSQNFNKTRKYKNIADNLNLINENTIYKEGYITGFFEGETANICSIFLKPLKCDLKSIIKEKSNFQVVKNYVVNGISDSLAEKYSMRYAIESDAPQMADLYKTIFETYPTPMNNPEYIVECMRKNVHFTVIEHNNKIVSACSAEIMSEFKSAEISDCATLPEHRGNSLLSTQFICLEKLMKEMKIKTLFSYSRALSLGMNLVNKKLGYRYGGCLIKNSNICGNLENMNVWYKNI